METLKNTFFDIMSQSRNPSFPCLEGIPVSTTFPSPDTLKRAQILKNLGNINFKNNKYKESIDFYTRAIELFINPHVAPDPTLYNNRGFAYLKLQNYNEAIRNCTESKLIFDQLIFNNLSSNDKKEASLEMLKGLLAGVIKATFRLVKI